MKFVFPSIAVICLAAVVPAQVKAFGGSGPRHSSTIFVFTDSFEVKAGLFVQNGQPVWKDAYNDENTFNKYLDTFKGKLIRLGKDWWTTFDTSTTVNIGGTDIPAGSYFLGLSYERDGSFQLAVIDAATAMKNGEMPFVAERWTVAYKAPLQFKRDAAQEVVKEMTVDLIANKEDPSKAVLQIAWGRHQLVGDIKITFAGTADASGDKGDKKK